MNNVISDVPVFTRAQTLLPVNYLYLEESLADNGGSARRLAVFSHKSIPSKTRTGLIEGVIISFKNELYFCRRLPTAPRTTCTFSFQRRCCWIRRTRTTPTGRASSSRSPTCRSRTLNWSQKSLPTPTSDQHLLAVHAYILQGLAWLLLTSVNEGHENKTRKARGDFRDFCFQGFLREIFAARLLFWDFDSGAR